MRGNNIIKLIGMQGISGKYCVTDVKVNKEGIKQICMETKIQDTVCPHCGCVTKTKKDTKVRNITHGEVSGSKCIINLKYIRYKCKECKKTFYEDISDIVSKYYRYTNVSILNVLDKLGKFKLSIKDISKMTYMDHRLINRLFEMKVETMHLSNLRELPPHIGIDEFKGNMAYKINDKKVKIKYQIQITDLDTSKVIALLPIKDNRCIEDFLKKIRNKREVKVVAIDMSMQFKRLFLESFKKAKIVIDFFHTTKMMSKSVDDIRLDLWRKYKNDKTTQGKEIRKYLKSLKNYLLSDYNACKDEKYIKLIDDKLNKIFTYLPELKTAYNQLQAFYDIKRIDSAEKRENTFKVWFRQLEDNCNKMYKSIKKTVFHWHKYICEAFKSKNSNARTEGNNNSIKVLKRTSYGFGNFENAKNRILVCC